MSPARTLPSARSNGEPLTGHLSMPPQATITHMLSHEEETRFLMATDGGYGFMIKFSDFFTNYKNGKAVVTVKENRKLMAPQLINDVETDTIVAVTNKGRLLIFPLSQLPQLKKGQGNKIITIPKKEQEGKDPERLKLLRILPLGANLVIHAGKHFLRLGPGNQKDYTGMRGYRGKKLPRGYRRVDRLEVIPVEDMTDKNQ
ncbi:MAG: hypothetical protein MI747_21960 [Desulfobacterales bacterium]|nr:hypothetical protein [Desulfobacterales bacterium]